MSNKRINKAYIRYDGNGRVIPGALLLNRFKPSSGGKWHEIPAYECCNPTTTTTSTTTALTYTIGQAALGGKIAYILQPGDPGYDENVQHGLVATVADTGALAWGCLGLSIPGAEGTAIGTGNQNTISIIADCTQSPIAAKLCGNLVEGGYSDWYLPSKDELNKLYINQVAIGGFVSDYYLSSTQGDPFNAWTQSFLNGNPNNVGKSSAYLIRAIRAF